MSTRELSRLIGNFSGEEQADAALRNDGRTDPEWLSECGTIGLFRCGEGFIICCMGFYDPWLGTLEQALEYLNSLGEAD